jgi:aminoglycoside 3-N-acetyltransferase
MVEMAESRKPTVRKGDIVQGLRALGLKEGDAVLVHSSLSSLGHVEGGADTVIDALIEAVGTSGTVIVPTHTATPEHSADNPPVFSPSTTPCWVGKIPETFRKRPGAIRSRDPTHSVAAIGAKARYLTKDHEKCITPCGVGSPYLKLAEIDGHILFIGIGLECNTTFHAVEELANSPYHLQLDWVDGKIINDDGTIEVVRQRIHLWGAERDFPKMEPILLSKGIMRKDRIGNAVVRLVRVRPMIDLTLQLLTQDPEYLLKKP